jgi:hypothetical protein
MLPGIENSIRASNNGTLYTLSKEIHQFKETRKWPSNSTAGYFIDEFVSKYKLTEQEVESQLIDAVIKCSNSRFRKSYETLVEIAYESAPGVHTRHQCECGRASVRRDKCILCLVESVIKT